MTENVLDPVHEVRRKGGELFLVDDELRYRAPQGVMTGELLQAIRQNKPDIIGWLERTRKSSNRKLRSFYGAIAKRFFREDADRLNAIPGWRERLWELEEGYVSAWRNGSACRDKFVALRDHWLNGLKTVRPSRVLAS